ncbi:DUF935 domain-containing protein [Roseibium sp. CAU 1637]|uniref:DUF935 domain-containing protein n=1 Tax=Roseibium limicola TaxID=2816037 RepID=A0A939ENW2_9HYPH|nr:DUF935 domain-containing protein [Roseibium limicola]MBO0346031.1 DUF935 domain-containing protein [Roseibium limicola]
MVQLVDPYGRPVSSRSLKVEQAGPQIRQINRSHSMHPSSGLTPTRLAAILRSSIDGDPERYLALAEDMEERNEHYAGVLGTRKRQVSSLDITVEAATDSPEDVKAADLVREITERDAFKDELFDVLDAVGKGFSATEILWDTSEGQWRPKAFKWRDPRWFRFDQDDGETLLLRGLGGDEPLRPFGWITHFGKVKSGLPIRGGLARGAAWAFLFKSFSLKDWAIFSEAYGQPLRLGKFGPGASDEDKDKLHQAVANIGADFSAIVPESMAIEFIEASLSGSHDLYEKRADWLDRQVSKLVLGQTQTTDATAGGYATAKVHDGVRDDIELADARQLGATLNRDLVRPLVDLNFGPRRAYPRLKIGRPDEVDIEALVKNVVALVPLGLKVGMSTMRDHLGLPDPDPKEDLLMGPRASEPTLKTEPKPGLDRDQTGTATRAEAMRISSAGKLPKPDAFERAIDDILADDVWVPLVEPVIAGLEDDLAAATTIEEAKAIFQRRLETLGVTALADTLAKASFAARISGETGEGTE